MVYWKELGFGGVGRGTYCLVVGDRLATGLDLRSGWVDSPMYVLTSSSCLYASFGLLKADEPMLAASSCSLADLRSGLLPAVLMPAGRSPRPKTANEQELVSGIQKWVPCWAPSKNLSTKPLLKSYYRRLFIPMIINGHLQMWIVLIRFVVGLSKF